MVRVKNKDNAMESVHTCVHVHMLGVDHSMVPGTEVGHGKCPIICAGKNLQEEEQGQTHRQTQQDRGDSGGHDMAQTMVDSSSAPRR